MLILWTCLVVKEGSCFYAHATASRIAAATAALLGLAAPSISTAQADQLPGALLGPTGFGIE
ncbi:hypothetical protein [Streptomyces sp. YS-3]|uniref:hypothetical protein n=1 Tax=Streptomyces sp. YS-3 TaxID=3381352 RepID=UPI0038629E25